MFGTSDSRSANEFGWDGRSVKLTYEAYPELEQHLTMLLESGSGSNGPVPQPALGIVQLVFPALTFLRKAGPPDSQREQMLQNLAQILGSSVWDVRDLAAHTICTMVLNTGWASTVVDLLDTETDSANQRHGIILAVTYIIERRIYLDPITALSMLFTTISESYY